ncbi:MAG TPA: ABC transporter permease [Terriglobales bacterium]|jgi:peptide/nickel transport system permease protein|nr:ABC transporter permease [Terriglobales bacterium]
MLNRHPMLTSLVRHAGRIAITVVVGGLLGATLVRVAPGFGIDEAELDSRLSAQSIQALRQAQPGQSLGAFYFQYFVRLLRGDLGTSRSLQRPVAELLAERAPETAKSVALGLVFGWTLGLSLAIAVVMSCSWTLDLMATLTGGLLLCLPAAVLALIFQLARMPGRLVLALIVFPNVFRYSRNLLARSASLPHVLTARAKGLGDFHLMFWHILTPAAPQLLALAGVSVSIAFTAAIPVEALCDLPGLGQLAWKAALSRDLSLLVTLTMIVAVVTLVANSLSDLLGKALSINLHEASA